MSKNKQGFISILIVFVLVLVLVGVGIFFYINSNRNSQPGLDFASDGIIVTQPKVTPDPTPFPFKELTIPYLRDREYVSKLGNLVKYSENSSYTAYLTSYESDGLNINGYLTIPKGEQPGRGFPAIVFVHGYIPPTIYNTTSNYVSYVDYLAKNGFVVFKIDLRGHGKSEGEAGGAYYSGDYVVDTLNARAALQSADFVNQDAIGLWGHSMAGNVTFRSFVAAQDIPAIVIWAGAVYTYEDFSEYRISDNSYRPPGTDSERQKKRELLRETYGEFEPNDDFWKQVPATNYIEGVNGALQIHHAIDDTVVSIGYSRNLMTLLEQTKVEHELFEYPSGGHNLTGSSFTKAMQRTVDFYNSKLLE